MRKVQGIRIDDQSLSPVTPLVSTVKSKHDGVTYLG